MRMLSVAMALALVPNLLAAQLPQQNPSDRLRAVLPPNVADQVSALVNDAIAKGLPGRAIAERALEGAAKGRSGAEVVAAAQVLAGSLAGANDALRGAGRTPDASEVEAAATAMELGVDGQAISALASSAPSGRSLVVPMTVLGALVNRGLPSDGALQTMQAKLTARATDIELMDVPGEAGRLLAGGMRPSEVGLALASSRAGFTVPPGVPANAGQAGQRPEPPVPPTRP